MKGLRKHGEILINDGVINELSFRNAAVKCVFVMNCVAVLDLRMFYLSRPMRKIYLSHRRSAKAQASLRIRAFSPEPSLFANAI